MNSYSFLSLLNKLTLFILMFKAMKLRLTPLLLLFFFTALTSCIHFGGKKHAIDVTIDENRHCEFMIDGKVLDVGENTYIAKVYPDLSAENPNARVLRCSANLESLKTYSPASDLKFALYFDSVDVSEEPNFQITMMRSVLAGAISKCGFVDLYGGITDFLLLYMKGDSSVSRPTVKLGSQLKLNGAGVVEEPVLTITCELKAKPRSTRNYWI